jgi:aminoglycoside phosphotransferase (APT) family kinase protein
MEAGPSATDVDVEGIDRDRVTSWMAEAIPGCEPPFTFELIAGGRSNLTYRVTDAAAPPSPSAGPR